MTVVLPSVVAGATPSPEGSYSGNLSCMVEPAGRIKPPQHEEQHRRSSDLHQALNGTSSKKKKELLKQEELQEELDGAKHRPDIPPNPPPPTGPADTSPLMIKAPQP